MIRQLTSLTTALALVFTLAACGEETSEKSANNGAPTSAEASSSKGAAKASLPANAGPAESMNAMMQAARSNDMRTLLKMALPDKEYAEAAKNWETKRKEPITEQQRKEFADNLAKLTGPTAIDDIMREVEPKLAEAKANMPMMIGMGVGMLQQSVQANTDLTDAQKQQATAMLTAMQGWAMKTDFTDAARMRKALSEMASAVKATKITSLDQVQELSFDQLLDKSSVLLGGFKNSLKAYDFNIDDMLKSYKVEQLSMNGDSAKVKTTMTMFGQTISSEDEMIKVDGRWMSKASVDALKKATENMTGSKLEQPAGG